MLEWRTRDNRYKSCSAFIDTAEESIDARFLFPALGRTGELLRGQLFDVISLLTPPLCMPLCNPHDA
jgi:hypothetical protein